ncbi:hypothetical protein GCM10007094_13340 [Pseudovibrio japonicus]|uniref:Uncharacterized protein n=1 Tax=Pseudovibrio japonicus TaxID=366534 RepID=A0ABQ3E7Y3_9HYPH|nr:hypothetical protein [Pseudovibrio japonicus]GHB26384.1 hypothetical protein GCM10007094_13340 [Pseudovibrio japonicus]
MATIALSVALNLCLLSIAFLFVGIKNRRAARSRAIKRKVPVEEDFALHPLKLLEEEEEKAEKTRLKQRDDL